MSDPADINDRLEAAAIKAEGASEIMRRFANDPAGTHIPTESGTIPSLAEWMDQLDPGFEGLPGRVEDLEQFADDLQSEDPSKGAALLPFDGRNVAEKLSDFKTILDYGATCNGSADDSSAATAMLLELNYIVVPPHRTAVLKNIQLQNNSSVVILGAAKLPNGCSDFDRMFYGAGITRPEIFIKEIDGNAAGQSGNIGTHFIYLTNCSGSQVHVKYAHDHYYTTGAPSTSIDGIRDASSGPIFLYRDNAAKVRVGYFEGWGREGVQLRECVRSSANVGHMQGRDGGGEYSGVQVSGIYNQIERASVDNAGASAVGFDTVNGICANIIATNTRENHGVNGGHTGFPCSGSVFNNIVVDGCMRHGISIGASSTDVTISNFNIKNAGESGVNVSDGTSRVKLDAGVIEDSGQFNVSVSATEVNARNLRFSAVDTVVLNVSVSSGLFQAGETVTADGITGVVRHVVKNRSATTQILFLSSASGTFTASSAITGGTSGASGTISTVSTPVAKRELSSGLLVEEATYNTAALGEVTKLSDGTTIFRHTLGVTVASANTLTTQVFTFPSTVGFVSAPKVNLNIATVSSTNAFTTSRLSATRTANDLTVNINVSVAQTYSVDILAIGRWKA